MVRLTHIEWILLLTAFAAGTVDIISFATLGGVFASAMTGNFALLAYYVAQGDSQSAMGSVVALMGFAAGCAIGVFQRRGRSQEQALGFLLARRSGFAVVFCALCDVDTARCTRAFRSFADIAVGRCNGIASGHRSNHQFDDHGVHDNAPTKFGRNDRRSRLPTAMCRVSRTSKSKVR